MRDLGWSMWSVCQRVKTLRVKEDLGYDDGQPCAQILHEEVVKHCKAHLALTIIGQGGPKTQRVAARMWQHPAVGEW